MTVIYAGIAARQAGKAANAATASANVAHRTRKQMQVSSQQQLRAYVYVHSCKFAVGGSDDQELRFSIHIQNFGQTPAYDLSWWTKTGVAPPQGVVTFPSEKDEEDTTTIVLGPGGTYTMTDKHTVEGPDAARIRSDDLIAYIWGCVEYRDAFDRPQHVNMRFRARNLPGTGWVLQPTKLGNDAT